MVRHHEQVDMPQWIIRRHQLRFRVPRQVTTTQEPELAELNHEAQARSVVRLIDGLRLVLLGVGVGFARVGDHFAAGCDDFDRQRSFGRIEVEPVSGCQSIRLVVAGRLVLGNAFREVLVFVERVRNPRSQKLPIGMLPASDA
jgi:hypothetical protein